MKMEVTFAQYSLTCRQRHLRCDELRPVCSGCQKIQKTCTYPLNVQVEDGPTNDESINKGCMALNGIRTILDSSESSVQLGTNPIQPESSMLQHEKEAPAPNSLTIQGCDAQDSIYLNSTAMVPKHPDSVQPGFLSGSTNTNDLAEFYNAEATVDTPFARWLQVLTKDAEFRSKIQVPISFRRWSDSTMIGSIGSPDLLDRQTQHEEPKLYRATPPDPSLREEKLFGDRTNEYPRLVENLSVSPLRTAKRRGLPWRGLEPAQLQDHEKVYFEYYVKSLASWIDMFDPSRYFGNTVPHLAVS